MPGGCKNNPSAAVVVSPTCDRFHSPSLVLQAIEVFGLEKDVFTVFVVMHVVLLVIDYKSTDSPGDGVARIHHAHLKGPERRMADIGAPHHVAIRSRRQRNMAVVVERVKAVARLDELLKSARLFFSEPALRLGLMEILLVLKALLVGRVRIGAEISIGPDHAVTQTEKQLIIVEQV